MKKLALILTGFILLITMAFADYPAGYTETSISGLQIWGHSTPASDAIGISWNENLTVQFTIRNTADYSITIPDIYMSIDGFDPKKADTAPGFLNAKSEKTIYETYAPKNGAGTGINNFVVELFNNTATPTKLSKPVFVEMPIKIVNTLQNSSVDYTSKKINLKFNLKNYSTISYPVTIKVNYWPGGELNTLTKNISISGSEEYSFSEILEVKELINQSLLNSNGKSVEFCSNVEFTTSKINELDSDCTYLDIDMLIPRINDITIAPLTAYKDTKLICDVQYTTGAIEDSIGVYKWYKNLAPIENGSGKYFNCTEQGCNQNDKISCSFELSIPLKSGTNTLTKESTEITISKDNTELENNQEETQENTSDIGTDTNTQEPEPNLISTQGSNTNPQVTSEDKAVTDNTSTDKTEQEEVKKGFWARLWEWILSWFS